MATFYENYAKFPKTDCGYCGNPSCVTLLRRYSSGDQPITDCVYFKSGLCNEGDFTRTPLVRPQSLKREISYVNPCASDADRVAVEVHLSEDTKYGYFDMITANKLFGAAIPGLKISPALGIARYEIEGKGIMGFSDGRLIIRRASSREDAFWLLSRFVRSLWAAVN